MTIHSFNYGLDTSVRPQDDFYSYVNNSWLAANPIPASESRWGTFSQLRDEARYNLKHIYENLQNGDYKPGSIEQQARDFYYSGLAMDETTETSLKLVDDLFKKVDAINSPQELSRVLGELHKYRIGGVWATFVDADNDNSSRQVIRIMQAGLTLPDKDYYLEDNEKMKVIRARYAQHAEKMYAFFPGLGESFSSFWNGAYSLELDIAKVSRSSTDLRDVTKNYHLHSFADIQARYSSIDWSAYANGFGWTPTDVTSIDQPEVMAYFNDQIATRGLDDWKSYLKWNIVVSCGNKISSEISAERFEFFGRTLGGLTEILPLWKRVVGMADSLIGEAVGRLYAKEHFPESSKQEVNHLVEIIRDTYKERILRLDWMSDETKAYALKKLTNIKVLVGYPDTWRDFSGLTITRDSYLQNCLTAAAFDEAYWLKRLHEPTSRDDWFMDPQTVNAYHDPNRLVICFPAAILQPPFYDPSAHFAANMGGIGSVIGHELSHGFDDQGCLFDADGNVRTWQTEEERASFSEKAKVIIDQADNFKVLPDLTLKGGLVIGESIADLGGLEIAYEALETNYSGNLNKVIDEELTVKQLFFANFARSECSNTREEKLREYALSDPHPNSEFRVNGMVCHVDAFYEAFGVAEGDKLYRDKATRAFIW